MLDQPTTDEERCALAREFVAGYCKPAEHFAAHWKVYADGVANQFSEAYCPWPLRMYILHEGRLALKTMPHGGMYTEGLQEMAGWLESFAAGTGAVAVAVAGAGAGAI